MLQSNITLCYICSSFFFNDTATTEIYTLSLHDALPIFFDSSEISESVNFCVMEAIKLCRLDTPIIFIEARINLIGVSNLQRDRKSGSAGMPRPISYAVFCLKKKKINTRLVLTNAQRTVPWRPFNRLGRSC